jgi:hypothetical protein
LELGLKNKMIIEKFSEENLVKLFLFRKKILIKKEDKNCCEKDVFVFFYQKRDYLKWGKMRFCCTIKLDKEIVRVKKNLVRTPKSRIEVYRNSYKVIRGSVGHIIFKAFLGQNESKYIRESGNVKNHSLIR